MRRLSVPTPFLAVIASVLALQGIFPQRCLASGWHGWCWGFTSSTSGVPPGAYVASYPTSTFGAYLPERMWHLIRRQAPLGAAPSGGVATPPGYVAPLITPRPMRNRLTRSRLTRPRSTTRHGPVTSPPRHRCSLNRRVRLPHPPRNWRISIRGSRWFPDFRVIIPLRPRRRGARSCRGCAAPLPVTRSSLPRVSSSSR